MVRFMPCRLGNDIWYSISSVDEKLLLCNNREVSREVWLYLLFIVNIADAGRQILQYRMNWNSHLQARYKIASLCSYHVFLLPSLFSAIFSFSQLIEDEFHFLLWADFLICMFCFSWYLPCKSFFLRIKSVEACSVLPCMADSRDSCNWQPYR